MQTVLKPKIRVFAEVVMNVYWSPFALQINLSKIEAWFEIWLVPNIKKRPKSKVFQKKIWTDYHYNPKKNELKIHN